MSMARCTRPPSRGSLNESSTLDMSAPATGNAICRVRKYSSLADATMGDASATALAVGVGAVSGVG
jgi:hypothetical protein